MTKAIGENGNLTYYIVGITLSTVAGERDLYLRIMRSSAVLKYVKKLEKALQSQEEGRIECSTSSEEDIPDNLNKRRKI